MGILVVYMMRKRGFDNLFIMTKDYFVLMKIKRYLNSSDQNSMFILMQPEQYLMVMKIKLSETHATKTVFYVRDNQVILNSCE